MIEFNVDYDRQKHSAMFVALTEEVKKARIEKAATDSYLVFINDQQSNPILIEINGTKISTSLTNSSIVVTDVVENKTTEENVWLFFIRVYPFLVDQEGRYYKEEYIFTRQNDLVLFQYLDAEIHTLSIKGMNVEGKPIRVKYLSKQAGGSVTLTVKDGYINSDDKRYPVRFIFTGERVTFMDIAKATGKVIAFMRAQENPTASDEAA